MRLCELELETSSTRRSSSTTRPSSRTSACWGSGCRSCSVSHCWGWAGPFSGQLFQAWLHPDIHRIAVRVQTGHEQFPTEGDVGVGVDLLDLCNVGTVSLNFQSHMWRSRTCRCSWSRTVSRGSPSLQIRQLLLEHRQLLVLDCRRVLHFEESGMLLLLCLHH